MVHRLQIGISGLATMLLLVGLANIIMDRARQNEMERGLATLPAAAASAKDSGATDPLADIGVAPAPSPSAKAPRGK
jgi:hypothetical protein